jgi:hypothetical protein
MLDSQQARHPFDSLPFCATMNRIEQRFEAAGNPGLLLCNPSAQECSFLCNNGESLLAVHPGIFINPAGMWRGRIERSWC